MSSIKVKDKYTIECWKPQFAEEDNFMASCVDVRVEPLNHVVDIRIVSKRALLAYLKKVFPALMTHPDHLGYRKAIFAQFKVIYDNYYNEFMRDHYPKLGYDRELYKHQKETLMSSIGKKHNLWALSMGLGKTISAASLSKITSCRRTVIICPSLVKWNWFEDMTKSWGYNPIYWTILDSKKNKCIYALRERFVVLNYEQVEKNMDYLLRDEINHIIIDECFPYHTPVVTNIGVLPIGRIVEEKIDCYALSCDFSNNELSFQRIEYFNVKERENEYIRIKHEHGELVCTRNHKIYIEGFGYKRADQIKSGDNLRVLRSEIDEGEKREKYRKVLFYKMRKRKEILVSGMEGFYKGCSRKKNGRFELRGVLSSMFKRIHISKIKASLKDSETILLNALFSKMENATAGYKSKATQSRSERKDFRETENKKRENASSCKGIFGTNEEEQSDAHGWNQRENDRIIEGPSILESWRKWKTDTSTTKTSRSYWPSVGIRCEDPSNLASDGSSAEQLQIGSRLSRSKTINRGGWKKPSSEKQNGGRQEKNSSTHSVRVDGVEILELGSGRQFGNVHGEDKVYNIQVARNRNYFANGVLVSNCHYTKNSASRRSKAIATLMKKSNNPRLTMLTGTPVPNRIIDMFNYLKMSDHPLGKNKDRFKKEYTLEAGVRGGKIIGAKNLPDLKAKISNLMIRLRSEDCLDLPAMLINKYYFEFDELSSEYNDELNSLREKKDRYEKMEGKEKAKMSHEIKANIHTLNRIVATSKVEKIRELAMQINEEGEKVIIFSSYKAPLEKLSKLFGDSCVKIDGSVDSHKRMELINRFKEDDSCTVFLGNMVAAGIGINLVNARHVIFMNFPFTPDQIEQAQKRVHRPGQTDTCHIYYTLCRNTIDEHIHDLVAGKAHDIDRLIDEKNAKGLINYNSIPSMLFKKLLE